MKSGNMSGKDINRDRAMLRLLAIRGCTPIKRSGDEYREGEAIVECVCGQKHVLRYGNDETPEGVFGKYRCVTCGGNVWCIIRTHSGGIFNERSAQTEVLAEWLGAILDSEQRWSWPW